MRADVFYRRFNSRRESLAEVVVDVPDDAGLLAILEAAGKEAGVALAKRAGNTGAYAVQTDKGLWDVTDGGSLISYDAKRGARVRPEARFITWEEAEEQDTMDALLLRALEITQPSGWKLYLFGMDGKQLPRIASPSRLRRNPGTGKLEGYQRPEVVGHISDIRQYLESEDALLPNAVCLAFDKRVSFIADPHQVQSVGAASGVLRVPLVGEGDAVPGFIIDGQQRSAAVNDAALEGFPMAFTAFLTDELDVQVGQFVRVNKTKPLPKALINELLPSVVGALPGKMELRREPATLLERLNLDADSPLRGLIITATNPKRNGKTPAAWKKMTGLIADNSMLRALEASISDGALYQLSHQDDDGLVLLKRWWTVVQEVFPDAWGKSPVESRLFHGVGILAMSLMMDAVCGVAPMPFAAPSLEVMKRELELVAPLCRWTEGEWDFSRGKRKWNDIQNLSKDTTQVCDYLVANYQARRRALAKDFTPLPVAVPEKKPKRK